MMQPSETPSQQRHKIEGLVVDRDNHPVPDVWVRVYRGVDELATATTGSEGRYEIEFDRGNPITLLRYDHLHTDSFERRHPAIVSNLSGDRDHKINKVMPDKVGLAYSQPELLEILSAYECLYVLDGASNLQGMRRELYDRYHENLPMMKHVDPITEQRHQQVLALYDQDRS
jgi:hypothetical protein